MSAPAQVQMTNVIKKRLDDPSHEVRTRSDSKPIPEAKIRTFFHRQLFKNAL